MPTSSVRRSCFVLPFLASGYRLGRSSRSDVGDVAHSNGGRYQVDLFPVSGAPWRLEVELPVRRVTGADRDSVIEGAHWPCGAPDRCRCP